MPPPVPQACQPIAAEVASLEAADQALRAQLVTLTGAAAWAALAQLGQGRIDLNRKRAELDACVQINSAALQGSLVVIDLGPPTLDPPTRVAGLWTMTKPAASQVDSSPIQSNSFAFSGPLPAGAGISIATTGEADVLGPDFRSAQISAATLLSGSVRIEVVLGPVVRIEQVDVARWIGSLAPTSLHLDVGAFAADLSVTAADAALTGGGIIGRVSGQVVIHGPGGALSGAFVGSVTLGLVPSASLGTDDLCDLVTIKAIDVQLAGVLAAVAGVVNFAIGSVLHGSLTDRLGESVRRELPIAITNAFVLPGLPAGVMTSVRRLTIDPTAIVFQPALGAVGTILSTFVPPQVPHP